MREASDISQELDMRIDELGRELVRNIEECLRLRNTIRLRKHNEQESEMGDVSTESITE